MLNKGRIEDSLRQALEQVRQRALDVHPRPFQATQGAGCELGLTIRATPAKLSTSLFHTTIRFRGITLSIEPTNGQFDRDSLSESLDPPFFERTGIAQELSFRALDQHGHSRARSKQGNLGLSTTGGSAAGKIESVKSTLTKQENESRESITDNNAGGFKSAQFAGPNLQIRMEAMTTLDRTSRHQFLTGLLQRDEPPVARLEVEDEDPNISFSIHMEIGPDDVDFQTEWKQRPTKLVPNKERLQELLLFKLLEHVHKIGDFALDWESRSFNQIEADLNTTAPFDEEDN